jgi:hypothetical protein
MIHTSASATERALGTALLATTVFAFLLFTSASTLFIFDQIEHRHVPLSAVGATGQAGAGVAFLGLRLLIVRARRLYLLEKAATQGSYC